MKLSPRVSAIPPSTTIALDTKAKAMIAAGENVLNMAVGEPDFPAPSAAQAAAVEKVQSGNVRYTPASGTIGLRKAIARDIEATRGVSYEPGEITVCHSAKHALSGVFFALLDQGDEVLLTLPAWVSYFEQIRFAGGTPVGVEPLQGCRPDLDGIRRAITPKTRGILLNSPSNPSGYVMTEEEVRAVGKLCEEHDLWVVSDEIYRRLVYEGEPNFSPASVSPELRARTFIVDGASKTYAMTGYRIGYVAGPAKITGAVGKLHSQLTGSPNAVSQEAYQACLQTEPKEVAKMFAEFRTRRDFLVPALTELGLEVPPPRGAFYAFPNVSAYLDERGSTGFCEDLLEAEKIAIVPGSAFGLEGYVRFSYALPQERIREAMERFTRFLASRPTQVSA